LNSNTEFGKELLTSCFIWNPLVNQKNHCYGMGSNRFLKLRLMIFKN